MEGKLTQTYRKLGIGHKYPEAYLYMVQLLWFHLQDNVLIASGAWVGMVYNAAHTIGLIEWLTLFDTALE